MTDASTGTAYHFDARCWLSAAEGLERTLPASLQGSQSEGQTDYQMVFFTGSVRQAGTDANVCVELRGTSGSTGALRIPVRAEGCVVPPFTAGRIVFSLPLLCSEIRSPVL